MFYGAVSDFFAQAVISFLLGHRNLSVFSEFLETLNSADAASVVKLSRIRSVAGAYILSTLQEASRDSKENYGFVITFSPINESTRYSTYSLRNKLPSVAQTTTDTPLPSIEHAKVEPGISEFYAFKAMPGHTGDEGTCQELVNNIIKQIAEVHKIDDLIVEKDIMDYAFKRFLWL
ncbi:uncharacterized protein L201_007375 [Kwoniella dendrophila CBS 6074]|uniref:Uncharacterized protein n=1 Tax=Kwoniella dendrophila CBS 6074 TaxID=1295534 RepID=A0AAX4K5R0_9TREE